MNDLSQNFTEKVPLEKVKYSDDEMERKFVFVSAELLNFLPAIRYEEHLSIFNNIFANQKLNKSVQNSKDILDTISLKYFSNEINDFILKRPCIFCSWHLGAYNQINHFIAQKGIPYSVVVSKAIFQLERDTFIQNFNKIYSNPNGNNFSVINAESPTAILQILRDLKGGKSILFYIDGNTGVGSTRNSVNNCYINFLDGNIFARKGVAYLSYMAKVPILPIASYRVGGQITFEFGSLMYPDLVQDRNDFAGYCTQNLYDFIAPKIKMYPDQWEGWLYLYKSMKSINTNPEEVDYYPGVKEKKIIFNSLLFGLFRFEQNYYLFNKRRFMSYVINRDIYKLLKAFVKGKNIPAEMDENLFSQFYRNQVLVRSN